LRALRFPQAAETAHDYVDCYLAEMKPADPVQRMLAVQMLWQHTRINQLIRLASGEREVELLRGLNTAIDQAMNTSRRMALAWEEVRNPRPSQHIRGDQVNVAEQQVVAGSVVVGAAGEGEAPESVSRNELGEPKDDPVDEILSRGARGAAASSPEKQAVGGQHGPKDG